MKTFPLWIIAAIAMLPMAFAQNARQKVPPETTWYWQLSGSVDPTHSGARLYDIDMEDNRAILIDHLKNAGHIVICYFSAGTYEPWRSDSSKFPRLAIGSQLHGWSEYYVDIRDPTVRRIMQARMDLARSKGCNGFEPDVLDAFENASGFPITRQDETDYIKWLASEGHERGLLVALKNDPELVPNVVDSTDLVIAEQCFQYRDCSSYSPFIRQGKAVLLAEYTHYSARQCSEARVLGFSLTFYDLSLDGRNYQSCR